MVKHEHEQLDAYEPEIDENSAEEVVLECDDRVVLAAELVMAGAITPIDRKPGYRFDPIILGEMLQTYLQFGVENQAVGNEIMEDVDEDDNESFDYIVRHSYRYLVRRMVSKNIIDKDVAFLAGLLSRPSSIKIDFKPGSGTSYSTWNDGFNLYNYLGETYGIDRTKQRIRKRLVINEDGYNSGIHLNAVSVVYDNDREIGFVEEALEAEGVELSCEEVNSLVMIKTLSHEFGHVVTEAKIYSNIINRINAAVDLSQIADPQARIQAIADVFGELPGDTFEDVIRRAFRVEESNFTNWVLRECKSIPELVVKDGTDQHLRKSSDERIANAMGRTGFKFCLESILKMRGLDTSGADIVANNLEAIEYETMRFDFETVLGVIEEKGLSMEIVNKAMKEIDRRHGNKVFDGYTLSELAGYFYPLTEEELIKVLKPINLEK